MFPPGHEKICFKWMWLPDSILEAYEMDNADVLSEIPLHICSHFSAEVIRENWRHISNLMSVMFDCNEAKLKILKGSLALYELHNASSCAVSWLTNWFSVQSTASNQSYFLKKCMTFFCFRFPYVFLLVAIFECTHSQGRLLHQMFRDINSIMRDLLRNICESHSLQTLFFSHLATEPQNIAVVRDSFRWKHSSGYLFARTPFFFLSHIGYCCFRGVRHWCASSQKTHRYHSSRLLSHGLLLFRSARSVR